MSEDQMWRIVVGSAIVGAYFTLRSLLPAKKTGTERVQAGGGKWERLARKVGKWVGKRWPRAEQSG